MGVKGNQNEGEKKTKKRVKRQRLLPSEIHKRWVFDLSASAVESKHDTACQTERKRKKETQTDEAKKR